MTTSPYLAQLLGAEHRRELSAEVARARRVRLSDPETQAGRRGRRLFTRASTRRTTRWATP